MDLLKFKDKGKKGKKKAKLGKVLKKNNKKNKTNSPHNPARVVILVLNTSSRPVLHLYQAPSKYSVGYWCTEQRQEIKIQTQEGEITPKVKKKSRLSFLYVTCPRVLFFITTKYHQNIPKSVRLHSRH